MPLDRMQNRLKILFVTSHWSLAPAYVIVPSEQEARSTTFEDRACALLDFRPISPPTDTGGRAQLRRVGRGSGGAGENID